MLNETMTTNIDDLRKDMAGAKIEILPNTDASERPEENPGSLNEEAIMAAVENGEQEKDNLTRESPTDAKIREIREKIEKAALAIEEKVLPEKDKELLGDAIKEFAQRLLLATHNVGMAKEGAYTNLYALLKESETLGSKEWEERFITEEKSEEAKENTVNTEEIQSLKNISGVTFKMIEDLNLPIGRITDKEEMSKFENEHTALRARMMEIVNNNNDNLFSQADIIALQKDTEVLKQKVAAYAQSVSISMTETPATAPSPEKQEKIDDLEPVEEKWFQDFQEDFQREVSKVSEILETVELFAETEENKKRLQFFKERLQTIVANNESEKAANNKTKASQDTYLKLYTEILLLQEEAGGERRNLLDSYTPMDLSFLEEIGTDTATTPETKTEPEELPQETEAAISAEIETRFKKSFALAEEDLKGIVTQMETPDGEKTVRFSDLSEGQQLLLLENLKDFALDNAKEQALKGFLEEEKKKHTDLSKYGGYEGLGKIKMAGMFLDVGFYKNMWLGATKTFRRASDISTTEKRLLLKPEENKEVYKEVLQEMLGQASEGPEAEMRDGKLQINFALEKDFEGIADAKERVKYFNDAAAKFTNIPHTWAYSKNDEELVQFQEAEGVYRDAKWRLGRGLLEQSTEDGKDEVIKRMDSLDRKVHLNQLFTTHPETEKAFAKIIGKNHNIEGVKAFLGERSGFMLGGTVLRSLGMAGVTSVALELALGAGLSTVAAPLAAAIGAGAVFGAGMGGAVGGYMAGKRASEEISDTKKLAKMGITGVQSSIHTFEQKTYDYDKEKNEFTEKEGGEKTRSVIQEEGDLEEKLEHALNQVTKFDDEGDTDKKQKALRVLTDRLYYTEQKIQEGLVAFGEGAEGFKNRYELNLALKKGRVLSRMHDPEMERKINVKIKDILLTETGETKEITTPQEKIVDVRGKIDQLLGGQTEKIKKTERDFKTEKMKQGLKYGIFLGGVFGGFFAGVGHAVAATTEGHEENIAPNIPTPPKAPATVGSVATETVHTPVASTRLVDELLQKINRPKTPDFISKGAQDLNIQNLPKAPPATTPLTETHALGTVPNIRVKGSGSSEAITQITSEKAPVELVKEAIPGTRLDAPIISPRDTAIENSLQELGKIHTVVKGDNVWNIIKLKLGGNENFSKLPSREQNFVIDSLKDKITRMSPKELRDIGIQKDPNLISPGNKLDFSKVFNNSDELKRIFNRAEHLPVVNTPHPNVAEVAHPTATSVHQEILSPKHHNVIVPRKHTTETTASSSEVFVPHGRFGAFSTQAEDIPSYKTYEDLVYKEIHSHHPDVNFYNTSLRDFLATHPNGLRELDSIFHMKGVATPGNLPKETLDGNVLGYWTRQAVQDDYTHGVWITRHDGMAPIETSQVTLHAFTASREQIPPQYTEWVQRGIYQRYPRMSEVMHHRIFEEKISVIIQRNGYEETLRTINGLNRIYGVQTQPIQLHRYQNATIAELMQRMAWQRGQIHGTPPPRFFPHPHFVVQQPPVYSTPYSGHFSQPQQMPRYQQYGYGFRPPYNHFRDWDPNHNRWPH